MVNDSFDFNNPLNFDNSLDNLFDFDHFWNLLGDVNYFLNDCWDFYHLMNDLLDRHNFLDNLCLDDWYLQRNVNNPLNFDDFLDLHNLLDLLWDWNDNGHFDSSLNDLFNDLLNLNNFRDWPEDS